jgi:putative acetyltransferase
MPIQGNKVTVRPLHPDDVPAIYDLLEHSFMIGNMPYDPSIELSYVAEWLAKRDPGVHRYVAVTGGKISGLLILTHKMRPRLNHSGTISMAAHSTNYYEETRQALLAAALDLADNWLNLYRVDLELSTEAKMDIDYFQSIGFEAEGTRVMALYRDGKWLNQLFMARLRINPQWLESSEKAESHEPANKPNKPIRQIKKIGIRPTNIGDVNAFYEMLRDPAICRTTFQLPSQEIWQTEERLKKSNSWLHRFTAVADGQIAGSIALVEAQSPGHSHIARIAMKVHSDYWGHGIGSMLMKSVTALADKWLKIIRIELDVNSDNPAGIRLYQNSGFVIEGKKRFHGYGDGRWADSYFMARIQKK